MKELVMSQFTPEYDVDKVTINTRIFDTFYDIFSNESNEWYMSSGTINQNMNYKTINCPGLAFSIDHISPKDSPEEYLVLYSDNYIIKIIHHAHNRLKKTERYSNIIVRYENEIIELDNVNEKVLEYLQYIKTASDTSQDFSTLKSFKQYISPPISENPQI